MSEAAERNVIFANSDSEEGNVDLEEEDSIIPDFREDTEDPQKPHDTSSSSFQLHTYSSQTSDSSEEESLAVDEDDPHISNEDELQVLNENKLV
ncbi:hypothetical protein FQA39_LY06136 [Lamprigera yunnana]|nr:hypothetical protein FQA39_LY06136 [Lamprigera yunnana]